MASSLMATQSTLLLGNHRIAAAFPRPSSRSHLHFTISKPNFLPFSPLPKPFNSRISASMSTAAVTKSPDVTKPAPEILTGATRTVTTLVAIGLTASKFLAHGLLSLAVQLREPLLRSAGPAFFAAAKDVPTGSLNTPFTVVAAGMAKWLDLYSGVLMVRVLLSWFPNIPWDRQPLSAIRDLCDPYLNLFRNIIPPIFDTLDVSPLLAFAVLGTLGSILNSSRQSY
ncbi:YlmG protein 1-1, chloroplastic [Salvia divinorum]|uniref:YlmG protein 1-1, chloroplastic n=1 Tax=Salvia divinorum TaxID=28513 RepID=A0ABD1HC63_SALDI